MFMKVFLTDAMPTTLPPHVSWWKLSSNANSAGLGPKLYSPVTIINASWARIDSWTACTSKGISVSVVQNGCVHGDVITLHSAFFSFWWWYGSSTTANARFLLGLESWVSCWNELKRFAFYSIVVTSMFRFFKQSAISWPTLGAKAPTNNKKKMSVLFFKYRCLPVRVDPRMTVKKRDNIYLTFGFPKTL